MLKGMRIQLDPNNKQNTLLFRHASVSRFAYNWALNRQETNYENGGKFISEQDLRKEFTKLRHDKNYEWLKEISNDVPKQAIKDLNSAYIAFFEHKRRHPKHKPKYKAKVSFYQDPYKIQFTDKKVFLSKIGWIRLREWNRAPIGKGKNGLIKIKNPRVTFDGLHWWISFSIKTEIQPIDTSKTDGIGIDLGIKELAVYSNGYKVPNINKSKKLRRLERRRKRVQRRFSRKIRMNKKGKNYCKTKNSEKSRIKQLKIERRISNLRNTQVYYEINKLVRSNPELVCIKDLNVSGMLKNHKLARSIQGQRLRLFRTMLEYKCHKHDIPIALADRWFPSSKTCYYCRNIKHDLKLSDRMYHCPICGNTINRDYQAALNLRLYGYTHLQTA